MAGLSKYFLDTPYQVIGGNIVYASNLNNPFAAIATGMETLSTDIQTGSSRYAVDTGGVVNAYVVSLDPAPAEYTEGLEVWLKTATTNTGAATVNVNSLGVIDIRRYGLDPLLAGDIPANYFTLLKYSNGYFQVVSASGRGEAEVSAETATLQAVIATEQAVIATTQAGLAEDAKDAAVIAAAQNSTDIATLQTLVGDGCIGVDQAWTDVTEARTTSTTYTNSSGRPIMLSVQVANADYGADLTLAVYVGGVKVIGLIERPGATTWLSEISGSVIVPNGSTYRVDIGIGDDVTKWVELR